MRIGEGGSGTVYKAMMHGCDEVAVKVVRTAHPAPDEAAAFQKEVRDPRPAGGPMHPVLLSASNMHDLHHPLRLSVGGVGRSAWPHEPE